MLSAQQPQYSNRKKTSLNKKKNADIAVFKGGHFVEVQLYLATKLLAAV